MNVRERLESGLLGSVEKPSRYLGSELNAVHKSSEDVDLRVALIFPDLYDLGLGNLGVHILYSVLNQLDWCWAERAYAPAPDMEKVLRDNQIPIFANESKDSLGDFDALGFTLQTELTFTNILNMIDLAGMKLRTVNRDESAPLTFAGGPSVFNPEPLSPFMDFFVIGDGEDVVIEIAKVLRQTKGQSRTLRLEALAEVAGVYVPSLYPMEDVDGRILPAIDGPKIRRRVVRDLNKAHFPVDYIVPFTQQVHDRVGLEVLRGCTQGCRFCQAGMTTRPVRERTPESVTKIMSESLDRTGYEEVSLVSLSTCDHSKVKGLINETATLAAERRASVSLPSLRLDSFSVELADKIAGIRRGGLTFAPETATPRMRGVINKWIPDETLIEMTSRAMKRGWKHVKMYFMIGLPTERDEDVEAIADLTLKALASARSVRRDARIHTGVSTFVPKPFTPFQWAEQIDIDETWRRQRMLKERFYDQKGVKFGRHSGQSTFIEGLISRSDRRAGDLIEAAFLGGARLDAWDEYLNFRVWMEAVESTGFDTKDALRERDLEERLPWDHIDIMTPKSWFQEDWKRATELKHAPDCRQSKCHKCGVIDIERELCATMLRDSIAGAKSEDRWEGRGNPLPLPEESPVEEAVKLTPAGREQEKPPVQRIRFRITRLGEARFLSHLEIMNSWIRSLRRASAPLAWSQGFHQHPKVTFATAAPVGESSLWDVMDILLTEAVEPSDILSRLQAHLPMGFGVISAEEVPIKSTSLMASVSGFKYRIVPPAETDLAQLKQRVSDVMAAEEILVQRKLKSKGRRRRTGYRDVDIKSMVAELAVVEDSGVTEVIFETRRHEDKLAKWREMLGVLGLPESTSKVIKTHTYLGELQ